MGRNRVIIIFLNALLLGCAGRLDYVPPTVQSRPDNSIVVNKPRDVVWKQIVPALGKQFFVINNMDKDSGFINLSYSGDPERYVDCGRIVSYVKNARGERTYDFPGSKSEQQYEIMNSNGLFLVNRKMSLEGRINLTFEEISSDKTRVTANTKYVLSRASTVQNAGGGIPQSFNHTMSFNSGQSGTLPGQEGKHLECHPTGLLEREVLSLAN